MWRGRPALAGLVLLGLLAGCTPADEVGSPAQRVGTWVRSTQMGQAVGTVLGDATRIDTAVRNHQDTNVMHTICAVLLDDAGAADGNLPTPDSTLTNLLSDGYGFMAEAARDCYDAGSTNGALLARSERERSRARALLRQALDRVARVTGHSVPTTTTTEPGAGGIFG